jgi:N-acetylglutamate synthase-like GNAT family acetyltransferase
MNIVDLDESTAPLYFVCLEDWSEEMKEAGNRKEVWYHRMKNNGLRVKLALDDNGTVGGMIHYVPIEHSFAEGSNLYFINCIWVHGYKQGRGDFRHKGMGMALLEAAEKDAKALGAKGIVGWGIMLPVFMRSSWFKRHGFRRADRMGFQELVWKPFTADAIAPRWIRPSGKPLLDQGKVTVTAFCNGWCPAQNMAVERARRATADPQFSNKVIFREIDTSDREALLRYGMSDSLFINHKKVPTGPPPSYNKIHKLLLRQVHKLPQA